MNILANGGSLGAEGPSDFIKLSILNAWHLSDVLFGGGAVRCCEKQGLSKCKDSQLAVKMCKCHKGVSGC